MRSKEEAIQRLKLLEIHNSIIEDFEKKNKITCIDWLRHEIKLPNKIQNKLNEISKEYGITPYIATFTETIFGNFYEFLYVGPDEEYWEPAKQELSLGYAYAWVYNIDHPELSEMGRIKIEKRNGIIFRIH